MAGTKSDLCSLKLIQGQNKQWRGCGSQVWNPNIFGADTGESHFEASFGFLAKPCSSNWKAEALDSYGFRPQDVQRKKKTKGNGVQDQWVSRFTQLKSHVNLFPQSVTVTQCMLRSKILWQSAASKQKWILNSFYKTYIEKLTLSVRDHLNTRNIIWNICYFLIPLYAVSFVHNCHFSCVLHAKNIFYILLRSIILFFFFLSYFFKKIKKAAVSLAHLQYIYWCLSIYKKNWWCI